MGVFRNLLLVSLTNSSKVDPCPEMQFLRYRMLLGFLIFVSDKKKVALASKTLAINSSENPRSEDAINPQSVSARSTSATVFEIFRISPDWKPLKLTIGVCMFPFY